MKRGGEGKGGRGGSLSVCLLPEEAKEVARECGNLPLALAMVGAMLRGKPRNRWGNVLERLRNADLEKIRLQFPNYPYADLFKAIQVSVEALKNNVKERYFDFAVFPEDTLIPEVVLQKFWEPEGLDDLDTQDVIDELVNKSLASRDEAGNLRLHDLQLDYVRKQATSENPTPNPSPQAGRGNDSAFKLSLETMRGNDTTVNPSSQVGRGNDTTVNPSSQVGRGNDTTVNPSSLAGRGGAAGVGFSGGLGHLHNRLLNAYKQDLNGWHTVTNDGYIYQQLAYHLIEAGRTTELQQLLLDFQWLQAKLEKTNINALITDYDLLPQDKNLQLVQGALRLSAHILAENKTQLVTQLWGRLVGFEISELKKLLAQAKQNKTLWLRSLTPSLTPPGGPLIRTLTGHSKSVYALALTLDGKYAISASDDTTVKVWNWQTGEVVRTLTGHSNSVNALALTLDGKYAISASDDTTVKVWNWQTGEIIASFTGDSGITCCAVAPDGVSIIAGEASGRVHFLRLEGGGLKGKR
ncbi:MAG: NB-ARC domain-containing protein [Heteroscytonema crispum UTEX LB 1556]